MRSKHEKLGFENGGITKGNMDCHLVTVKVGIKSSTDQGMQLNGFAFDQFGLEGLDS
jgi:hypothetical protein